MPDRDHFLSRDQVVALLDERDALREENRQLKAALAPIATLPRAWRLTATESTLLRAMRSVGPNVLHRERAMLALYGTWEDAPCAKILDVLVCKIRTKLMRAQTRIHIETVWGRGFRLSAEGCGRFDEAIKADRAAWHAAQNAAA